MKINVKIRSVSLTVRERSMREERKWPFIFQRNNSGGWNVKDVITGKRIIGVVWYDRRTGIWCGRLRSSDKHYPLAGERQQAACYLSSMHEGVLKQVEATLS